MAKCSHCPMKAGGLSIWVAPSTLIRNTIPPSRIVVVLAGWGTINGPHSRSAIPAQGKNQDLSRILIGMADAYMGIDLKSFQVTADFAVDGIAVGENLASRFKALPEGRWEWQLAHPVVNLPAGTLTVSIKDRQGNFNSIKRKFSVTSAE